MFCGRCCCLFRVRGCWSSRIQPSQRHNQNSYISIAAEEDATEEEEEELFFDCFSNEGEEEEAVNFVRMEEETTSMELRDLLSQLTEEELETAARTSFHYAQSTTNASPADRIRIVRAMAQRFLTSKKTVERSLAGMKATLQFRREQGVDELRTAFDGGISSAPHTYTLLEHMLSSQKNFVMGYDKEGRSTFHFVPRRTLHHDLEWTLKESLYTIERAIACSRHPDKTVNAVIDFNGFDFLRHSPPLEVGQQFLTTLRCHYVGQLHKIFLLDPPLGFTFLWRIFENFVGTSTRQKIVLVSGPDKKQAILGEWYSIDQAAPWMMVGGQKDRALDLQEYLYKMPFDRAFDD